MAGLDYGVLVIKNKKLLLEDENTKNPYGVAASFYLPNIYFYKNNIYKNHFSEDYNDDIYIYFDEFLHSKYIKYWKYDNRLFKTKRIGSQQYLTSFKYGKDFYHIISGYDIAMPNDIFYNKQLKRKINKLINKLTKK